MVRGKWHFHTVGQGKYLFMMITEVFDFFRLHLQFVLLYVLSSTSLFDQSNKFFD